MSWTYSGIFIHRRPDEPGHDYEVYASTPRELEIFADEKGILRECFRKDLTFDDTSPIVKNAVYAAEVGYGRPGAFQDPTIYWMMRIGELDWTTLKQKVNP